MVVLVVNLRVQPGSEEDVKRYMRVMVENTRKEPGCLMYIAHQSSEDPTRFVMYEQYKDKAAQEFHMNAPYFAANVTNGFNKYVVSRDRVFCAPID